MPPSRHPSPLSPHASIGLLGGSFNPAHAGHVHISREAMRRLGLREIWWLVSPHNPLKSFSSLADYRQRVAFAEQITAMEPRIRVSTLEQKLGTRYTVDTLMALKQRFPQTRFIWLMGADNLAQLHRWRHWRQIMQLLPIAIMDRAPFSHDSLRSPAALAFARFRLRDEESRRLLLSPPPAWVFCHIPRSGESSTSLRKTLGNHAFLWHNSLDEQR